MRSYLSTARWVAAAFLCTMVSVRGARAGPEDAGPGKIKLTQAPLSAPQTVLCKPDPTGVRLLNDVVFVGTSFQFDADATKEWSLAGAKLKFSIADAQTFMLSYGGNDFKLVREEMSFKPLKLRIPSDRTYTLAFPYGYVHQFQAQPDQAQHTRAYLMLRSGSAQYFSLDGQSFCLYDANTDGYYRLGDDAIGCGKSGGAFSVYAPLGKLLATSKAIYQVRSLAEDGSELEYAPYTGATSSLSVATAQSDLEMAAAFSSSEAALSFVASPTTGRPTDIKASPGKYNLLYGLVYSPKLKKLVASVGPGKLSPADVSANASASVTLGGPYEMEFALQTAGRQLTINSSSFHLRGKNGEEYANFTWAAEPQVSLKVGDKTTALGKMEFG